MGRKADIRARSETCVDDVALINAVYSASATQHARCLALGPSTGSPAQPVRRWARHAQQVHMAQQLAR